MNKPLPTICLGAVIVTEVTLGHGILRVNIDNLLETIYDISLGKKKIRNHL